MLTGFWPIQGEAGKAVTHCLRVTKDGKKLLFTPWIEAERLGSRKSWKTFSGFSDKNEKHFAARNHRKGAKVAYCKISLVDGNVTVGGGKATPTKTYRHGISREIQQITKVDCVLTGDLTRRGLLRNTKNRRIERAHARFANLIQRTVSAFQRKRS